MKKLYEKLPVVVQGGSFGVCLSLRPFFCLPRQSSCFFVGGSEFGVSDRRKHYAQNESSGSSGLR